jgi:hypothetical protein
MKHFQPGSLPNRPQASFYIVGSFVGWLICDASPFCSFFIFALQQLPQQPAVRNLFGMILVSATLWPHFMEIFPQ